MLQRQDDLMRGGDDEERALSVLGSLGKWRLLSILLMVAGMLILLWTDPPRGAWGLAAWVMFALGGCTMWISYTRIGRDIAAAADEWIDNRGPETPRS